MYKNKVVLITGSSRGVGLALTNYFLKHDAVVIGISKGNPNIEHQKYHHFSIDIGDSASIVNCFSTQIAKKFKQLDNFHFLRGQSNKTNFQKCLILRKNLVSVQNNSTLNSNVLS